VRRQKLPKDDAGDHYTWKDLNVGVNVTAYGKVFHFYDCDKFTRVGVDCCTSPISLSAVDGDNRVFLKVLILLISGTSDLHLYHFSSLLYVIFLLLKHFSYNGTKSCD